MRPWRPRIVRARLRDRRLGDPLLDPRILVGGLQDGLLLMPGALAEHAVEAQPDEQSDQRKDDNDRQLRILFVLRLNIVRAA